MKKAPAHPNTGPVIEPASIVSVRTDSGENTCKLKALDLTVKPLTLKRIFF